MRLSTQGMCEDRDNFTQFYMDPRDFMMTVCKNPDNEAVKASMLSAPGSTHQPVPPPTKGRKDRIPLKSSGASKCGHKTLILERLMSRVITRTCLRLLILLLFLCRTNCEDVPLHCTSKVHLTSANYPSHYPNDAYMRWHVTAPSARRILVEFIDFDVEETFDFLEILDIVDIRNTERYTGKRLLVPSFLTQANALNATFASFGAGTRKGFNLSVSCYEKSNLSTGRLVGGNTPAEGFLELLSQSGEWVGVCEDNLSATVAEVICGELGYPGVKEIAYRNDGCHSDMNDQTCVGAPSCEDDTYLIRDCSSAIGNCTTFSSIEIKCHEPGYKGCYEFEVSQLQNGSTYYSASKCVSSCRGKTPQDIAILKREECFCSTAGEVNLPGRSFAKNQTTCISTSNNNQQIVNALVYNVSVGFCNQTDDVINGTWDSNITWFGSTVHLMCDDGYSLNGSEALQCVPGVSSYFPMWNDSFPTCDRFEDGTSSSSKGDIIEPGQRPGAVLPVIVICTCIIALIIFIIFLVMTKQINRYRLLACTYRHRQAHRTSTEENGQRTHSRRGHRGNRGSVTGPNINVGNSLVTSTHFYHDGELQTDFLCTRNQYIRISEPSEKDITLFPSFDHTTEHTENHYHTEEESHSYFSVMDSGVSNRDHTEQNRHRHMRITQNTYELGNFRDTRECRTEMKLMSNRPQPHRPFSCGVQEGPPLPPRGQTTSSPCGSSNMTELIHIQRISAWVHLQWTAIN